MATKKGKKGVANMDDALKNSEKFIGDTRGVGGILASLFRHVMVANSINGMKWAYYMRKWLSNPKNLVRPTTKDHSGARTNINRALFDSAMTWKVFYMGLSFMGFKHMKITLELTDMNNKQLRVEMPIIITDDDLDGEDADTPTDTTDTEQDSKD